jgi:hypothetical protein
LTGIVLFLSSFIKKWVNDHNWVLWIDKTRL